jgi:uncharacterized protein
MENFHNCHIHTFTSKAVPDRFLPLGYMKVLRTKKGAAITRKVVGLLMKVIKSPKLERVLAFSQIGSLDSQEKVFNYVQGFYPKKTKFVVLPMDFEFMNAGPSPQPYLEQLAELRELYFKGSYREVMLPFVAADPRRRDVLQLVRTYIEVYRFRGIKMYPALGFYPFDERLDGVWKYAEDNQIPVLVHASRGGVFGRLKITEAMRKHPLTGKRIEGGPKDFTDAYSDPDNYREVLKKYPNVKLCLAHWGGGSEWKEYLSSRWPAPQEESWLSKVSNMMRDYPNVYTDVAYTACDKAFHPLMKVLIETPELRNRIMYGSDYYMVQMDASEREFSIGIRAYLGDDNFKQIAAINPTSFFAAGVPARV